MARIAFITGINIEEAQRRKRLLEQKGYEVDYYSHPDKFLEEIGDKTPPDLILTAFRIKGTAKYLYGEHVGKMVRTSDLSGVPVIVYSTSYVGFESGEGWLSNGNWGPRNDTDEGYSSWDKKITLLKMDPFGDERDNRGFESRIIPAVERVLPLTPDAAKTGSKPKVGSAVPG